MSKATVGATVAILGVAVLAASLLLSGPAPSAGGPLPSPAPAAEAPHAAARPSPAAVSEAGPGTTEALPERSGGQPYQEAGAFRFEAGKREALLHFPVPAGRRLTVEHVTVSASLGDGHRPLAMMTSVTGGGYATHTIPMASQGTFPEQGEVFAGTGPVRAYADGGTVVTFRLERSGVSERDQAFVSMSGRLD